MVCAGSARRDASGTALVHHSAPNPRSGWKHKAWGAGSRTRNVNGARDSGRQRLESCAVARFAGSICLSDHDPGAGAPGFMLSPASRALSVCLDHDPGAGAPGFMLSPASRALSVCLIMILGLAPQAFYAAVRFADF